MTNLVYIKENRTLTNSKILAEKFEKEHKEVLKVVRKHLKHLPEFGEGNFSLISYTDDQNREQPAYEMTQDGFNLIAMSFATKKALFYKIEFIDEFNRRGDELQKRGLPINDHATLLRFAADAVDAANARADKAEAEKAKVQVVLTEAETFPVEWADERTLSSSEVLRKYPNLWRKHILKWATTPAVQTWLNTKVQQDKRQLAATTRYFKEVHGLTHLGSPTSGAYYRAVFNVSDIERVIDSLGGLQ
jgi:Rha family phage regulatory protein